MQIQVLMPSPAVDFNFDSTSTSPFVRSPSTPQRFGTNFFYSEPEGNEPDEELYVEDDDGTIISDDDFEFEFSGQLVDRPSLTAADELFDGGKIKPLKPSSHLFYTDGRGEDSPRSPKPFLREALSFKQSLSLRHSRKKDFDPYSQQRGREITHNSKPRHKATRSLSPDMSFESQENSRESSLTWLKLRDLLLFRSVSEGGATTRKDPLKKYAMVKKDCSDEVKNSSFRSTDSSGSVGRRRQRGVSAHEMHYTANRAVTEEMRRKTFLPYKKGLLGCLEVDHVQGVHQISRGLGSALRRH